MREILFRGKAANRKKGWSYRTKYKNGDWVYGLLTDPMNWAGFAEMTNTSGVQGIEVDSNTVGQFTGFYDSTKWEDLTPEEQEAFLHQPDGWENTPDIWPGREIFEGDILEWDEREWGSEFREVAEWNYSLLAARKHDWHEWCKVVGNIHDNPELLEVK